MIDQSEKNNAYLNSLKSMTIDGHDYSNQTTLKYHNIDKFTIANNILSYEDHHINISSINLETIDPSIFLLNITDIEFILNAIEVYNTKINDINAYVNNILFLQNAPSINDNDKVILDEYLKSYCEFKEILNKVNIEELKNYFKFINQPILIAYYGDGINDSKYNKPACMYIREYLHNYNESKLKNGGGILPSYQRNLSNGKNILNPNDAADGFASSTLIISITVSLGITIAILTLFIL